MKTYPALILLSILLIIPPVLISACENREKASQNDMVTQELKERIQSSIFETDQEIIALLAVKYNKDIKVVEGIIDSYLSETDWFYKLGKLALEKEKLSKEKSKQAKIDLTKSLALDKSVYLNQIEKISNQFSIEQSIIASILFDYKTWEATKNAGSSE